MWQLQQFMNDGWLMVFNATFNNISVISWRSVVNWRLELYWMSECYLLKINITIKSNSITIFFLMQMIDKRIVCIINVLVQLLVSCLVSSINHITTQLYALHSHKIYTTDLTWYKQLYQHNMHIMCTHIHVAGP